MAINKEKKSAILEKLQGIVEKGKSIVFVNFHGLTVSGVNDLRKNLRGKQIGYYVAKKTLIKKAFAGSKLSGEMPELPGEIAVAYGDDPILPVKEIYDFHKKNAEVIKIAGGVFEGKLVDAAYMTAIAKIPGRETLYAQFVNVINSPIQGLVMALDAIATKKSDQVGSA